MFILTAVFALAFGLIFGTLVNGWLLMLALGAVHNDVFPQVPALGLWQSLVLAFALSVVGSFFKDTTTSSNS